LLNSITIDLPLFGALFTLIKQALNSNGDKLVLVLNNLLNDCRCSKPNSVAIVLTVRIVVLDFFSLFNQFILQMLIYVYKPACG